jgi:hypothetical protein
LSNKSGADELCKSFETGGGRKAAAGINVYCRRNAFLISSPPSSRSLAG